MRQSAGPPTQRRPERSASPSVAGYQYQFVRTGLLWLLCKRDEVLYCESNEDVDVVADDGSVEEVQVKLRKKAWTERSKGLRGVIANFAHAFCEHHEQGRRCSLVFTSSASFCARKRRQSALASWFIGKAPDASQLCAELTSVIGTSHAAYLTRTDTWRDFSESVTWDFAAGELPDIRERLLRAILASKRAYGLDPQAAMDAMLQRVTMAASAPDISQRSLSSMDLDVLMNDLWISKGVEQFDALPGGEVAILGSVTHGHGGKACVALFVDGIDELEGEYRAAVDYYRRLPEASICDGISDLSERDGGKFLRGAGFDVYAVADTIGARPIHELAAELVPYVSAREPPRIYVLGTALRETVRKMPEQFEFRVELADGASVAGQLVCLLADRILQACRDKRANHIFANVSKKIRVIQDLVAGKYYTQSEPPAWS